MAVSKNTSFLNIIHKHGNVQRVEHPSKRCIYYDSYKCAVIGDCEIIAHSLAALL